MAHLGIVCPPVSGHLNPLGGLGKELASRGHRVTLVNLPDAQASADAFGLGFAAYGRSVLPPGAVRDRSARLGALTGFRAVRFTGRMFRQETELQLAELPELLGGLGLDGLVVDQVSPAAGAVADHLGLPFATVCAALPLNEDPAVPPPMFGWAPGNGPWRQLRNRMGFQLLRLVSRPIRDRINAFRRQHGLAPHRRPVQFSSSLAILSQLPREFDFPRMGLPEWFHYTGPLSGQAAGDAEPFPFERLSDAPLVYASLGTLQNQQPEVFQMIAAACEGLGVQLVITRGHHDAEPFRRPLPGSPLVVDFAPQRRLLERAALTITHAGLNTALDSLTFGVPMVAIPITNDQPGVAARIEWAGVGEVLGVSGLRSQRLREAVVRVLREPSYRERAAVQRSAISRSGGVAVAADLILRAIQNGQPVLR
jgi:zeaxanthin glucosyltransferase